MGGQVEVNKETAGIAGEEMRVVLCEDDLESSQGGREAKKWKETSTAAEERNPGG